MLVYANILRTAPRPDATQLVVKAVGDWLGRKTFNWISAQDLKDQYSRRLTDGKEVSVNIAGDEANYPILASIVFGHPDEVVSGRKWLTRVGIRQESGLSGAVVSVGVETSDISVRAGLAHAFATRPGVISDIVKTCSLVVGFPGANVQSLDGAGFDSLAAAIEDTARQHAIVIVTPDAFSEQPLTNPAELAEILVGLAQVYQVTDKRNTFPLAQAVGRDRAAWNGAIRILYPSRGPANFVLSELLMPEQLNEIRAEGRSFKSFVLFQITHRLNLAKARLEITPQDVRHHALSLRLAQLRATTSKDKAETEEMFRLSEEDNAQLREQNEKLKSESADLYSELDKALGEVERLRNTNQALQHHLAQKKTEVVEVVPEIPREFESMSDLIESIESEMVNEIVLTGRAKRAMKDSPFTRYAQVYDAFRILQTGFHQLLRGDGNKEAVDHALEQAGIEYAPHMSEMTMGQFDDYNAQYKGRKADFSKHLKIGTSFDPQRTFRIHFEWDVEDKRVVVHHAGRHPTTSRS